jgi:Flp pilus assembly protein TadG
MIERWFRHRGCRGTRHGSENGQALVELALSVPLLILMLLGAVEMGRLSYAAVEVSSAAKAAAQYAILNGGAYSSTDSTGLDSTGMLRAAKADAYDVNSITSSPITFSSGYPTMTCSCSGAGTPICTTTPPSGCTGSFEITTVTVKTQTTFNPLIYVPLPGWHGAVTLHGYAQQEIIP